MLGLLVLPLCCAAMGTMEMEEDAILLATEHARYRTGQDIGVTLRNGSSEPIAMAGYCGLYLYVQQRDGDGWGARRSVVREVDTCMGFSVEITAGNTTSGFPRFILPEPGTYRLIAFYARSPFPKPGRLAHINATDSVVSQPFIVR